MKVVLIIWEDAASKEQWHKSTGDKLGLSPSMSCGLMVEEDDKQISLALTYHKETSWWRDIITIPKANILSQEVIKEVT